MIRNEENRRTVGVRELKLREIRLRKLGHVLRCTFIKM